MMLLPTQPPNDRMHPRHYMALPFSSYLLWALEYLVKMIHGDINIALTPFCANVHSIGHVCLCVLMIESSLLGVWCVPPPPILCRTRNIVGANYMKGRALTIHN